MKRALIGGGIAGILLLSGLVWSRGQAVAPPGPAVEASKEAHTLRTSGSASVRSWKRRRTDRSCGNNRLYSLLEGTAASQWRYGNTISWRADRNAPGSPETPTECQPCPSKPCA